MSKSSFFLFMLAVLIALYALWYALMSTAKKDIPQEQKETKIEQQFQGALE